MKYNVRFYLHTFVDFKVDAKDEKEAVEIAEDLEYDMDQLLDNMVPDNETDVEEIVETFKTKVGCYVAVRELVQQAGGYILMEDQRRPTLTIENDNVETDGEPTKDITIKSLFEGTDDSSPLKAIDINDECWDVDDYFNKDALEKIYMAIKK